MTGQPAFSDPVPHVINCYCFPGGLDDKESACIVGDLGLIPESRRSPWQREWVPTPVFLPRESHGQRSLGATVHGVAKSHTGLIN